MRVTNADLDVNNAKAGDFIFIKHEVIAAIAYESGARKEKTGIKDGLGAKLYIKRLLSASTMNNAIPSSAIRIPRSLIVQIMKALGDGAVHYRSHLCNVNQQRVPELLLRADQTLGITSFVVEPWDPELHRLFEGVIAEQGVRGLHEKALRETAHLVIFGQYALSS